MMSIAGMSAEANPYKRPASPTAELSMPPAKIPKTSVNQLQINYLKRERKETIPLATADESLPKLLRLIGEYDGVLQRHESLAGNLGACPVGPILLKRFERLFEGPPRILKSNSRDPNITWLDVVEFAQNKPEQFDLEKTRNGIRVCQFYLKQCRVEISEEDYVLIRSGMPQKLIPPQPILEDEEKELGVIEVLDRNLGKVVHSADQVSARARQLVHRLKNRRTAILARRDADGDAPRSVLKSNVPELPPSPAFEHNGLLRRPSPVPMHHTIPAPVAHAPPIPLPPPVHNIVATPLPAPPPISAPAPLSTHSPSLPSSGFTAVNPRHSLPSSDPPVYHPVREMPPEPVLNGNQPQPQPQPQAQAQAQAQMLNQNHNQNQNHTHSKPPERVSMGQQEDWMSKFLTPSERAAGMTPETVRREPPNSAYRPTPRSETVPVIEDPLRANQVARRAESRRQSESALPEKVTEVQTSSVPIPNTPASLIPQQKPHTWNRDDGGPYKAEMITRMETMKRGERVIPPCDRCRRLHMDCIKNLTACLGCTKKHAKCSWKDVSLDELESTAPAARERAEKEVDGSAPSSSEWDNMLKNPKGEPEHSHGSPASGSTPVAANDAISVKSSTPRLPSPQNSLEKLGNHNHEASRLDVRPPPLDQQLRDAADNDANRPYARFSPFQRPPQQLQYPHQHSHPQQQQQQQPLQHQRPKEDSVPDEGDRLAAIAGQVYRSASQNTARTSEQAS